MNTTDLFRAAYLGLAGTIVATGIATAQVSPLTTYSDTGILFIKDKSSLCGHVPYSVWGYNASAFGSYRPTGLTGGESVYGVADVTASSCISARSMVSISGFSANPGSDWLVSVTCNGVTNSASSSTYSYNSGIATWIWTTLLGLESEFNDNVTCTIVHD